MTAWYPWSHLMRTHYFCLAVIGKRALTRTVREHFIPNLSALESYIELDPAARILFHDSRWPDPVCPNGQGKVRN